MLSSIAAWTDAALGGLHLPKDVPPAVDLAARVQAETNHSWCTALACSPGIIHIVSITILLGSLPVVQCFDVHWTALLCIFIRVLLVEAAARLLGAAV